MEDSKSKLEDNSSRKKSPWEGWGGHIDIRQHKRFVTRLTKERKDHFIIREKIIL